MSNRISLIQGTTRALAIDLVDENGEAIAFARLVDATASFVLRTLPDDVSNILLFTTGLNPENLAFEVDVAALDLTFLPADTSALDLLTYYYKVQVTLTDGAVYDVVPWDFLDLNLGGAAAETSPTYDNTVAVNADWPLSGDMKYMTPGGSPIVGAQVRVYRKSDYDAGVLTTPVGITATDASGNWLQSILVTPGYTYVARLEKPYEFGPDVKEFFA